MIKIEGVVTPQDAWWEQVVIGTRRPYKSGEKSDSYWDDKGRYNIGEKDLELMTRLSSAGNDHGKFMRQLPVICSVTAPLYLWKELDTYKVGTVANSESTMHTIQKREFTMDDFSHEHLTEEVVRVSWDDQEYTDVALDHLYDTVGILNAYREKYLETKDKTYWWQLIQLLPSTYNQCRTWSANYQVLKDIYYARKDHRLDEWHTFCDWITTLPYAKELMGIGNG